MLSLSLGFTFRLQGSRLPVDGTPSLDLDFTDTSLPSLDLDFISGQYRVFQAEVTGDLAGNFKIWS